MRGFILPSLYPYIGIAVLSGFLYWQISSNGRIQSELQSAIDINKSNVATIDRLQSANQLSEILIVETAGKHEVIRDDVETVKYRYREVIRKTPDDDCPVALHPHSVSVLLNADN